MPLRVGVPPGTGPAVRWLGVSAVLTVALGSMRTTSAPSVDTGWCCTPPRHTPDSREGLCGPSVDTGPDAAPLDALLGLTGRHLTW